MAVVNDLKRLVSASRLFVDEKTAKENSQKLYSRGEDKKAKGKGKKRRGRDAEAKIGQGGTLDPLADGVLGEFCLFQMSLQEANGMSFFF